MTNTQPIGRDFFFREVGDPNYQEGVYESNDPIENAIQQVRMVLLTKPGEVLGEDIGFDAEQYLFEFENTNLDPITRDANSQISEYVLLARPYSIKARAFTLNDNGDPYKVGMGLDVSIDGKTAFATLFDL